MIKSWAWFLRTENHVGKQQEDTRWRKWIQLLSSSFLSSMVKDGCNSENIVPLSSLLIRWFVNSNNMSSNSETSAFTRFRFMSFQEVLKTRSSKVKWEVGILQTTHFADEFYCVSDSRPEWTAEKFLTTTLEPNGHVNVLPMYKL